ncbi:hypothetical protein [Desulfuromonas acetoxidans]|uniref:hypothetical protein n=1 Tax=Desulfuromonas acetoxidans TaxID=891 RepID=UPI00292F4965|nr:hypothetical protein [Desulfuromonas acetoxidans]
MLTPGIAIIGGSTAGLTAAINPKIRSPEKKLPVIRNVRNTLFLSVFRTSSAP